MTAETVVLSMPMAAAAGLVGSFAVMRRMSFAVDPLSHVALPGIGLALALHSEPIFGAVTALLIAAVLVWLVKERAHAATEAIIGVVFSAALALGSLTTTGDRLIEALFGTAGSPSPSEIAFVVVAASAIVLFIIAYRNSLVVTLVSPDIARNAGVNVRRVEPLQLLRFALTIALGLRYLGVVPVGALTIVPAVTAKQQARHLTEMLQLAVAFALLATLPGTLNASWIGQETAPLIVLVAAIEFTLSLLRH